MQGSLNYQFLGIKQYKLMVVLRDFPYNGIYIVWVCNTMTPHMFHCPCLLTIPFQKISSGPRWPPIIHFFAGTAWKCWAFQSDWAESQVDDGDFLQDLTMLFWVVVSNIFHFHPYLWKIPNLTNIFQMGWKPPTSVSLPIGSMGRTVYFWAIYSDVSRGDEVGFLI